MGLPCGIEVVSDSAQIHNPIPLSQIPCRTIMVSLFPQDSLLYRLDLQDLASLMKLTHSSSSLYLCSHINGYRFDMISFHTRGEVDNYRTKM